MRSSNAGLAPLHPKCDTSERAGHGARGYGQLGQPIVEDDPAAGGLFSLADLIEVSPYRLSRAFTRCLGVSVTRYRNQVRVARAMDRLEAGQLHLGRLAADLGFADQAHLTRTVREHLGHTPTVVRDLLRGRVT